MTERLHFTLQSMDSLTNLPPTPCLIKSTTLPAHTSSQQAELIALTQALTLAKDQKINIYTDSKYACNILHSNIIIWRKREFLTQKSTPILNASFIFEFLHEAQLQKQATVIHCWGHQLHGPISFYNNIADHKARWQATSVSLVFTIAQIDEPNICILLSYLHSLFQPSAKVLKAFLQNFIELTKNNVTYLNNMTQMCTICQWTNPNSNIRPPPFPNHQIRRHLPTQDWQVEFTHMPPVKGVKFLLVFVDIFSGWIEAFPTTNK